MVADWCHYMMTFDEENEENRTAVLISDWCNVLLDFEDDCASADGNGNDDQVATPVSSPPRRVKQSPKQPKHFQLDLRKHNFNKMPETVRGGQQRLGKAMRMRSSSSGGSPKAAVAPDISYTRRG